MSDRNEAHLPQSAEEMLAGWPVPQRADGAWDEAADRVVSKLESVELGSTNGALLAAPLPAAPGEGTLQTQAIPPRSRSKSGRPPMSTPTQSLAELARASVARNGNHFQAHDIAKETLSIASRSRANVEQIADRVRQSSPDAVHSESARPSYPTQVVKLADERGSRSPRRGGSLAGLSIAGAIALLGAAAAVVLYVTSRPGAPIATRGEPSLTQQAPSPQAEKAPPRAEDTVRFEDLPAQEPSARVWAAPMAPPQSGASPTRATRGGPQPKAIASSSPQPAKSETVAESAAAKDDEKLPPATQLNNIAEQPSSGAIQAAVGSVLSNARTCVAGHDAPSNAVVVFGSDGRVQSVGVSGPAAGTPTEGCIRTALKQARVQPFARPTFSVRLTVRP